MNPQLTERLTCPRCGPGFGLVLRADEVKGGRVATGFLGCSNCRVLYPVERGIADLRPQPRSRAREREPASGATGASGRDALHLAAMLGVTQGPAHVAVAGGAAPSAPALAALLPGVEIVALAPRFALAATHEASHLLVGAQIPLKSGTLAAIALAGAWAEAVLHEAVRSVAPSGRVVLLDASPDSEQALRSHKLTVLAREPGTLVARLG